MSEGELRPAVVLCHGLFGSMDQRLFRSLAKSLRESGFVVLAYNAHRMKGSGGVAANFSTHVKNLNSAINFVSNRPDVDPGKLIVVGHSMGASAAMHLASVKKDFKVVALSPVSRPQDVSKLWNKLGVGKAAMWGWLRSGVASLKQPVLIVHGKGDEVNPISHARELHKLVGSKDKGLLELESGSHRLLDVKDFVVRKITAWAREKTK